MIKKMAAILLGGALLASVMGGCSGKNKIVIGSKNFTENQILAEMMAQVIEKNTDVLVDRKINMGGTLVCFEAIKKGQIDLYPEYTGTGLTEELKLPVNNNPEEVYDTVKKEFKERFEISWLTPFGFNNTYAVALPEKIAQEKGIKTVSDLVPFSKDYVFGGEQEFFNREDGYPGLIKAYGLAFKSTAKMDASLKYQAIGQGKMQVTDAYTTDGQLRALNLTVLEDDKQFFPPYYAAPIVRDAALEKFPRVKEQLESLGSLIDDTTMQDLNFKADNEKQSIEKVAGDFLREKGLI